MTDPEASQVSGDHQLPSPVQDVSLRLLPYWPADPQMWFGQVEAQFAARHITSQATKYGHVIAVLPPEVAMEIRNLILAPPPNQPYDDVKKELISRTAASEQRGLQQLLNAEELGDRKPAQLLRRMRQLLGNDSADSSILRQLFLQRLPTQLQVVLAAAGDLTLDEQAERADRMLDIADPSRDVASVGTSGNACTAGHLNSLPVTAPVLTTASADNIAP